MANEDQMQTVAGALEQVGCGIRLLGRPVPNLADYVRRPAATRAATAAAAG